MNAALEERRFVVHYQPQYNHATGMVVGAEALVRWDHPVKGLIAPGVFIPIFEKNGFITRLDYYVFEDVCRFLHCAMEQNLAMVPVSVNFSVKDIFLADFVDGLETIRERYHVPAKYIRIELTEGVSMGGTEKANELFDQLHHHGYIIEMDDFGSGYSSLNVLKDLNFDFIKLEMLFLNGKGSRKRGGTILTSVVHMAKWLDMPIIAEGVETVEQADFLRSIGCDYVQGYLYSRPLPEEEYTKLISTNRVWAVIPQLKLIEKMNFANFWDPESQETLIFNNFVGGAAIFRYDRANRAVEMLRVNKKYLQELGMNLSEHEVLYSDMVEFLAQDDRSAYFEMLDLAVETQEEQECDTWLRIQSECCGEDLICLRHNVRVIGNGDELFLIYGLIRNVTGEKEIYQGMEDADRRFRTVTEHANIYFWEYTIATHEMRPCFRCMRDLGLPPLLRNYPESAFERGIFPPEVADMYRDWIAQLERGIKKLEGIIPLTMDRIPFWVRYTTEFDENGNPIKAYGSATQVVDRLE